MPGPGQVGASHLYTEDLNPGQSVVGVEIVNPLGS
jgi:predicted nucleic acid-binding protein